MFEKLFNTAFHAVKWCFILWFLLALTSGFFLWVAPWLFENGIFLGA